MMEAEFNYYFENKAWKPGLVGMIGESISELIITKISPLVSEV